MFYDLSFTQIIPIVIVREHIRFAQYKLCDRDNPYHRIKLNIEIATSYLREWLAMTIHFCHSPALWATIGFICELK